MMFTTTVILAEITIVLLTVVIVIGVKTFNRRRRDQDAVNTLVISIKANQPARVEKLAGILKDTSQLSDDDALNKANELIKKQNKFYQDAIDLYFTRNNAVLSKLDNRLEDLLDQYQGLIKVSAEGDTGVASEAVEQLSKDIASLSREIEELRTENAGLSKQLKAAEHELDQLGREYVKVFNRAKVDKTNTKAKDADAAEDERAETTEAGQAAAENEQIMAGPSPDEEQLNSPEQAEDAHVTEAEPAVEQAPAVKAEQPVSSTGQAARKADGELDIDALFAEESSDDPGLLAGLGLDELIGDQPGKQAVAAKAAGKI